MTLTLDYSDDYLVFDCLEPVVLERSRRRDHRQGDDSPMVTWQKVPVEKALRKELSEQDIIASGGALSSQDLVWLIPKNLLEVQPNKGDVVVDEAESRRWTVLTFSFSQLNEIWELSCRDLGITYDLSDLCDIERASSFRDDSGTPVKRFPPEGGEVLHSRLPCRLQPLQSEIAEEKGVRGFRTTYDLILDREIDITNEDRVKLGDRVFEVRSYRQSEAVGLPPVVGLEEVP